MRRLVLGMALAAVILSAAIPVAAHPGTSITYFADKSMTLTGVVTEFVFGYPLPQLDFDVTDPAKPMTNLFDPEELVIDIGDNTAL